MRGAKNLKNVKSRQLLISGEIKSQLQSVFESNGTLSDFTRAALFLKQNKINKFKKRLCLHPVLLVSPVN